MKKQRFGTFKIRFLAIYQSFRGQAFVLRLRPETPSLTPEAIVEQLRTISSQIPEATPMSSDQRNSVRNHARTAKNGEILQTTISMVGTTDVISNASVTTRTGYGSCATTRTAGPSSRMSFAPC
jgi:phage tail tape-measure protein